MDKLSDQWQQHQCQSDDSNVSVSASYRGGDTEPWTDRLSNDSNVCVSARGRLRQPWTDCLMTTTPVSATEGETAMDGQTVWWQQS